MDLDSVADTFAMAIKQKPKTENIYIVDGKVKTTEADLENLMITSENYGFNPVIFQDFLKKAVLIQIKGHWYTCWMPLP